MPPTSKLPHSEVGGSSFDPVAELLAIGDERPAPLTPARLALQAELEADARRWLDQEHRPAVQRGEQWAPGEYPRFCEALAYSILTLRTGGAEASDTATRLRIAAGPQQYGPTRLHLRLITTQETT